MANPNQSGQKLKFRVVDFSGEDPEYPATELLSQSPQSRGWQSPRFCDWPQFITLQFMSPVLLKQIQFLSHQCKIASKVELYTAFPDLKSPMPNVELKFKKMGYLSLDPNERSGFQSRELKTVYIEAPCLYLKIVFQKCHINKYNLFNQVGLIALGVFGEPLANIKEDKDNQNQVKYEKLEYETQFDGNTLARLKELEEAKVLAVKNEEFDEAKRIKEAIERLKHIGAQLQHLEERKAIAIQSEDYDSAKIIKQEIDRLRDAVAPNNLMKKPQQYDDQPVRQKKNVQQQHHYEEPQEQPEMNERPIRGSKKPQYEEPEEYKEERQPEVELPIQKKNKEKALFKNQRADDDDRPLPALQNKDKDQENPFGQPEEDFSKEAEFLTGENQKLAEPLIPIIGDDIARQIFSRTWNMREEGLKTLDAETRLESRSKVLNYSDPSAAFIALMGVASYTINDKIVQVAQKSMGLIQTILAKEPKNISNRNELNSYIDTIITGLLDRVGDTNVRTKELAEQTFLAMTRSQNVTCNFCVTSLVKPPPTGQTVKHKTTNSTRHVLSKLGLLRQIIQDFKINNNNVPYNPVVAYAVDKLENSNPEIRQASFNVLIDIYGLVGEKIKPDLTGVRPQHMEMLQKEFDAISGGGEQGYNSGGSGGKEPIITTNINPHGGGKKGGAGAGPTGTKAKQGAQSNKGPQSGDDGAQTGPMCEFCGRHDRNLKDQGKMDIHLWKECPMLTTCQICAQVVEIATLNQHLLEECENRKLMRKCPRCKEAIPMDEFKQHTDEMSCAQSLPLDQGNRCPLCHQDTPPGEIGWKKHLLYEGCPNNDRTV